MDDRKTQLLAALAHAARGDWSAAHDVVAEMDGPLPAWIHASLHREEGDEANARYWYREARRAFTTEPFADERAAIARALEADVP